MMSPGKELSTDPTSFTTDPEGSGLGISGNWRLRISSSAAYVPNFAMIV
jgi:hypothetical protein